MSDLNQHDIVLEQQSYLYSRGNLCPGQTSLTVVCGDRRCKRQKISASKKGSGRSKGSEGSEEVAMFATLSKVWRGLWLQPALNRYIESIRYGGKARSA